MRTVTITPFVYKKRTDFINGFLNSSSWIQCEHGQVLISNEGFSLGNEEYPYIIYPTRWEPAEPWFPEGDYSYSYLRNNHFGIDIFCHKKTSLYKYNYVKDDEESDKLPESKSITYNCSKTKDMSDYEFGEFVGTMMADALNVDNYSQETKEK